VLGGCQDSSPTGAEPPVLGGGSPSLGLALECKLRVGEAHDSAVCSGPDPHVLNFLGAHVDPMLLGGPWARIVFERAVEPGSYPGTRAFSVDVSVRNLSGQPLGTRDGHTLAPGGVRVVLTALDTSVKLVSLDGRGTFTAANQPYVEYDEVLLPGNRSSTRTWYWKVPAGVGTIEFKALLVGAVPHPDGWVEGVPADPIIPAGTWIMLRPIYHDPLGTVLDTRLWDYSLTGSSYTSEDGAVARFDEGLRVYGESPGRTVVHATVNFTGKGALSGSFPVTVVPATWPASSSRPAVGAPSSRR